MATDNLYNYLNSESINQSDLFATIIDSKDPFYKYKHNAQDLDNYEKLYVNPLCKSINNIISKRIARIKHELDFNELDEVFEKALDVKTVPLVKNSQNDIIDSNTVNTVSEITSDTTIVNTVPDYIPACMFNTCYGPKNRKQFLAQMHKYPSVEIMKIVNENSDKFNDKYAHFIISMHTGVQYDDTPIDIQYRLMHGMLCEINSKVIKFNLTSTCNNAIVKKYVPIYGTPKFNVKDLALDIIKDTKIKHEWTICRLARSYFTYLELMQIGILESVTKEALDYIVEVHNN
jgi:hypothetical protein